MNIIEQLCGYGKAKKWLDENSADIEWKHLGYYRRELLEYRRQHNIFEVGDKVVLKNSGLGSCNDPVYEVVRINKRDLLCELDCGWYGYSHHLRHATDEDLIKLLLKLGRKKAELLLQQGNFISHDISKYLESINIIGGFGSVSLAKKFLKDDGGNETIFGVEILRVKAAINDVEKFIKIKKDFNCRDYWNT